MVNITFMPKTPMPLKEGEHVGLRIALIKDAGEGVHEIAEHQFTVTDLQGIALHGQFPLNVLDDLAAYDRGGFVFGQKTVLHRIDLTGSAEAISKLKQCLRETQAM